MTNIKRNLNTHARKGGRAWAPGMPSRLPSQDRRAAPDLTVSTVLSRLSVRPRGHYQNYTRAMRTAIRDRKTMPTVTLIKKNNASYLNLDVFCSHVAFKFINQVSAGDIVIKVNMKVSRMVIRLRFVHYSVNNVLQ